MAPSSDSEAVSTSDAATKSTIRVIVADDQVVARMGTCRLLDNTPGIRVEATTDCRTEAVHLVESYEPDVVIAEAKLSNGFGTELPVLLKQLDLYADVLILSAYQESQYLKSYLEAGGAGYLLKCDDEEHLIRAIRGIPKGNVGWFSRSVASWLLSLRHESGNSQNGEARLTCREMEVLTVLAQGHANDEIATRLGVSVGTVKNHLTSIYSKIGVRDRANAIVWVYKHELVA